MFNSMLRAGLLLGLFGLLLVPGVSFAQAQRPHKVSDEAKLFSENAVDEANEIIAKIKKKCHKDLVIETRESIPADAKAGPWTKKRADELGVDGVYVLITTKPKHFEVYVGNKTSEKGYFTNENRDEVKEILKSNLAKHPDTALLKTARYTLETMERHMPAAAPLNEPKAQAAPAPGPGPMQEHPLPVGHVERGGQSWLAAILPWVCVIVGGLVVLWVIFAIIRALTGFGGGGGYGYGGGGYGGGYGGGGGGFLTGMLGGLFGSMAGMWIYNNMFGGHATYMPNGGVNWGGDGGGSANAGSGTPYESDTGGTTSGGDWGDNDNGGGADAGGGKGDDGGDAGGKGGDDGGGGGDWGGGGGDDGGGGDAGGGGGGDWGGGGDAGGGDWGGGGDAGGGGDWGGGGGGCGGGGGGCGGGGGGDW